METISLEEVKVELAKLYDGCVASLQEKKKEYISRYKYYLCEHYCSEHFPDNIELRFVSGIGRVDYKSHAVYLFSLKFMVGDFNLGEGYQDCYPYERYIKGNDAKVLHEKMIAMGLYFNPEPIAIDHLPDKLFPDLARKRKISSFLADA